MRQQGAQFFSIYRAQHVPDLDILKTAVAVGYGLIEQAERVAHAAVGSNGNQAGAGILCRYLFFNQNFIQLGINLFHTQVLEVELQTARQDGDGNPLGFGRRQQELYMRRRFFQCLQQRIEAVFREHVHFINEIHLVPARGRRVLYVIHQVPGFIHLGPRCRVDLDQINKAALVDTATGAALAAGFGTDSGFTVETLCQDTRQGRLAYPAGAGKQVGMVQPVGIQCVDQHFQNMVLPDHILEQARSPFSRENLVTHLTLLNLKAPCTVLGPAPASIVTAAPFRA